jgi:hypothetical protein
MAIIQTVEDNGQAKLEITGKQYRDEMLRYNLQFGDYSKGSPSQDDDVNEQYGPNNKNAKSDGPNRPTSPDELDKGKGTRGFDSFTPGTIDTTNGGSSTDKFGRIDILNSGREGQKKVNYYKEGKAYYTDIKIDTSKNKGQFRIK